MAEERQIAPLVEKEIGAGGMCSYQSLIVYK